MPQRQAYNLIYAEAVLHHMRAIELKYHSLIRRTIEEQLALEPFVETRNRKPLKHPGPFGARWELRFGSQNRFRVFYEESAEAATVTILAIGTKRGNRLSIGGEEATS